MTNETGEYLSPSDKLPLSFKPDVTVPFCDWHLVEPGYGMPFWKKYQKVHGTRPWLSPSGVELRTYQPTLGPSIADDEVTGQVGGYSTLLRHKDTYRLYHETYGDGGRGDIGAKICVLLSVDGVNWTRPVLDLIEYGGNRRNNIVFGAGEESTGGRTGGHGGTVFFDGSAPESERYKLVFMGLSPKEAQLNAWLYGAVSPDGLSFKLLDEPILKALSDTQNVCAYLDEGYRLYLRGWSPQGPSGGGGRRVVRTSSSKDFRNFPHPKDVLRPPSSFGPRRDIYTSAWSLWPGSDVEMMLPTLYDRDTDTTEIHLAVSRGDDLWDIVSTHPLLGGKATPLTQTVYAGVGILPLEKGVWGFPVHVSDKAHNEYHPKSRRLHIARIREDGFCGIEADLIGTFSLYAALFLGTGLTVNAWTRPGGSIRARLLTLDPEGGPTAVPGFDYTDMTPLSGDLLWEKIVWSGGDLSRHEGRPLRLEFELVRARLHSFRVTK